MAKMYRTCAYGGCSAPRTVWLVNQAGHALSGYCELHAVENARLTPAGYTYKKEDGSEWTCPGGERDPPEPAATTPTAVAAVAEGIDDDPAEGRVPNSDSVRVAYPDRTLQPVGDVPAPAAERAREGAPQQAMYAHEGTLTTNEQQREILMAPVPAPLCNIRDDGTVYLPWPEYVRRLSLAFGPGGWALVPLDKPRIQSNAVCVHYALIVRGHFISEALQSHPYYATNRAQTLDDAAEAAKSECLRRCCKPFGGALEPWDAGWRAAWKLEYAVRVWRSGKRQWAWRRKDAEPFPDEGDPRKSTESEFNRPRSFDEDAREHMAAVNPRGEETWAEEYDRTRRAGEKGR